MPLTASSLNKKILSPAVILLSVLSCIFFLVLFSSIRCEPDDMIISLELMEKGFVSAFLDRYHFYSFRPVYTLCSFVTIGYSNNTSNYSFTIFIFFTAVYALFVFAIYKLLQELFALHNVSRKEKGMLLCFSNIFIMCLYFLTTERIEIFGWISASIIHLTSIVFVFLGTWLILKQVRKIDYVGLAIASAFIAGGAEHISASIILSSMVILLLQAKKYKEFSSLNKNHIRKLFFFTLMLSLFLGICISNPGLRLHYNEVHQQQDGFAMQHTTNVFETIKLFCKPYKLIGLIFLLVCWMLFQNVFNAYRAVRIRLSYFSIALCCTILVSSALSIFGYHTLSVGRVWFATDVALFVLLSACIIKFLLSLKINATILYSGTAVFCITLVMFNVRHIPSLVNFSSEHDKIISSLQQKSNEETVVLESFPKPDLINQVELSDDPNDQVNQLFCRFYGIKAKVSVKPKQ